MDAIRKTTLIVLANVVIGISKVKSFLIFALVVVSKSVGIRITKLAHKTKKNVQDIEKDTLSCASAFQKPMMKTTLVLRSSVVLMGALVVTRNNVCQTR